jgi:hypothetical protein
MQKFTFFDFSLNFLQKSKTCEQHEKMFFVQYFIFAKLFAEICITQEQTRSR